MALSEIPTVPIGISLSFLNLLLAPISILEQLIEEFNWQDFNLIEIFESWNVHMRSIGDVQKYTIQEENIGLNVQMLAPRQAQIEEKLGESFVFDYFWLVFIIFLWLFI